MNHALILLAISFKSGHSIILTVSPLSALIRLLTSFSSRHFIRLDAFFNRHIVPAVPNTNNSVSILVKTNDGTIPGVIDVDELTSYRIPPNKVYDRNR